MYFKTTLGIPDLCPCLWLPGEIINNMVFALIRVPVYMNCVNCAPVIKGFYVK